MQLLAELSQSLSQMFLQDFPERLLGSIQLLPQEELQFPSNNKRIIKQQQFIKSASHFFDIYYVAAYLCVTNLKIISLEIPFSYKQKFLFHPFGLAL